MAPNVITTKTQLFPGIMLRCEFSDSGSSMTFEWRMNGLPMYPDNSFNISFTRNSMTLEIFRLRGVVYDLVYTCAVRSVENGSVITEANFTWTDMCKFSYTKIYDYKLLPVLNKKDLRKLNTLQQVS